MGRFILIKFNKESVTLNTTIFLKSAIPYVAPECLSGASPSVSSDIFALGACFYEMLVGEPAFQGETSQEITDRVQTYDPTPDLQEEDQVHTQLRRICQQMLRKKPQQRYQGYQVLLADLDAYRKNRGIEAGGSASELQKYLANPESYVSPERTNTVHARAEVRPRPTTGTTAPTNKEKAKTEKKQPQLARIFTIVGLVVVLFSGLSIAGKFFFSKDGKWGGNGNSSNASSESSSSSSTVTTRRGSGGGNKTVRASGSSSGNNQSGTVPVEGDSDPVEIVDRSDQKKDEEQPAREDTLQAVSLSGVDTVIVLPSENDTRIGRIVVRSDPRAHVFLEGDSLGITPLPIITNPGTYKILLQASGFPPFETLVDVVPNRETPVDVSLWVFFGRVEVAVNPAAQLFVDGEFIGNDISTKSVTVRAGKRSIKLIHEELGTFESEVEVTAGETTSLRFNLAEMK